MAEDRREQVRAEFADALWDQLGAAQAAVAVEAGRGADQRQHQNGFAAAHHEPLPAVGRGDEGHARPAVGLADRLFAAARERGHDVVVITADRGLQMRVEGLGCRVMSPTWLLSLLEE